MIRLEVYPRADEKTELNRIYPSTILFNAIDEFNKNINEVSYVEFHDEHITRDITLSKVVGTIKKIEVGEDGKCFAMFKPLDRLKNFIDLSDEDISNIFALDSKAEGCVDIAGIVDLHKILNYTLRLRSELLTLNERRVEKIKDFL